MKKLIIYFLTALALSLLITTAIQAQSNKTHNPYANDSPKYSWEMRASELPDIPTAPPPPPNPIPIDGGVGFLLAAGLGYGVRRIKKK